MSRLIYSSLVLLSAQALLFSATPAQAETLAWWRFEEGISGTAIPGSSGGTVWNLGVEDVSGNGNHLTSRWDAGSANVSRFDADVPPVVAGTNVLSMFNSGGSPSLFTWSEESNPTLDIQTVELSQWTIEAFFNSTNLASHRTMVGWDGAHPSDGNRAALYFKTLDNNIMVEYGDAAGVWHAPRGSTTLVTNNWYYFAAVNDGQNITLYLADLTAGDTTASVELTQDLTASSSDTRLIPAPDPEPGTPPSPRSSWSVGRGFWGSNETDRFFGNLDEVRISNAALNIATEGLLATGLPVVTGEKAMNITSPANDAEFDIGTTVTLTAEVTEGTISGPVVFSVEGTTIGLVQSAPYTMEWMPPGIGSYAITVTGDDNGTELVDRTAPTISVVGPDVDYDVTGGGDGVTGTVTVSSDFNMDEGDNWDERGAFAFDNNTGTFWTSQNNLDAESPAWIQFQLNAARSIDAYALTGRGGFAGRIPSNFTLEGSNNGTDWTVIDTVNDHEGNPRTVYILDAPTAAYTYYRMNVTEVAAGTAELANLVELELLDLPVVPTVAGDRTRVNLSTPDATTVELTATIDGYNGDVEQVQFFDGVRSLGYGTANGDGTFSLAINPTSAGTMNITALVWTDDDAVTESLNSFQVEVALFVNAVPVRVWTLH